MNAPTSTDLRFIEMTAIARSSFTNWKRRMADDKVRAEIRNTVVNSVEGVFSLDLSTDSVIVR